MKAPSVELIRALRGLAPSRMCQRTSHRALGCHGSPVTRSAPQHDASQRRQLYTTTRCYSAPPKSRYRGPPSKEDTTTDFGNLNVLGNTPPATASIDVCLPEGFLFGNGMSIRDGSGCLLVAGEAFTWRPWEIGGSGATAMVNDRGQWHADKSAWGVLELVWPKPEILVIGLGASMRPISPAMREYINSLGIRIEIQDTRNAASQFNLLATERGSNEVAAAFIPVGRAV